MARTLLYCNKADALQGRQRSIAENRPQRLATFY